MIVDILQVMLQRETTYNIPQHIQSMPHFNSCLDEHRKWRREICQWYYTVTDYLEIDREIVYFAIDYFDRIVKIMINNSTHMTDELDVVEYQLFALACLFVAVKTHSDFFKRAVTQFKGMNIHIGSFLSLTRDRFVTEDLIKAEKYILFTLEWKMNTVSPLSFVRYMLALLSDNWKEQSQVIELALETLYEISSYITELVICIPEITEMKTLSSTGVSSVMQNCYVPSYIAYSSILVAMELFTAEAVPPQMRAKFIDIMFAMSRISHENHCDFLHPRNQDIQHLVSIIRKDFQPEVVMDPETLGDENLITIAQKHGLIKAMTTDNKGLAIQDSDFVVSQEPSSNQSRNCKRPLDKIPGVDVDTKGFCSPLSVNQ